MKKILCIMSVMVMFVACDDKDDRPEIVREEVFTKVAFANGTRINYEGLNLVVPQGMEGKEDKLDREYEIRVNREEIITIDSRPDGLPLEKKDIDLGVYYVEADGDLLAYYTKNNQVFEIEYDSEEGNYKENFIKVLSSIVELN